MDLNVNITLIFTALLINTLTINAVTAMFYNYKRLICKQIRSLSSTHYSFYYCHDKLATVLVH